MRGARFAFCFDLARFAERLVPDLFRSFTGQLHDPRRSYLRTATYRSDSFLSLLLPGRHVQLYCAMAVNGRPRWTCRIFVSKVAISGFVEIAPLSNMPVIKDLATDMRPFFEKWQAAKGVFEPSKTRNDEVKSIRPDTPKQVAADAIECINSGRSATPPVTLCGGTEIIWVRLRLIVLGLWLTTNVTPVKQQD